jgi:hypothetical protein
MLEEPYRRVKNERLKYLTLPGILVIMRSVRQISRKDLKKEKLGYFLAGFVEGEGSFNVSLRRKADYKVNWQVVMSFNVSQKDPTILYILKDQLNCGIIKIRKRDGLHSFDATNPDDLIKRVIPYFRKYPVLSESKKKNFAIFCEIAKLMEHGEHRTMTGLKKILLLREKINEGKGRTRKYGINDVFPIQESSETTRQPPPSS